MKSTYRILDKSDIEAYLRDLPFIKKHFKDDTLEIEVLKTGRINNVFKIQSKEDPAKSFVLKQSLPYAKDDAENNPLNKDRIHFEMQALALFSEQTAEYIPTIYHTDKDMNVIVMEYMTGYELMHYGDDAEKIYPNFPNDMAKFLSINLFKTSSLFLNSRQKAILVATFNFNELKTLTSANMFDLVIKNRIEEKSKSKSNLPSEPAFRKNVLALKYKYLTQFDALNHGDISAGAILLSSTGMKVIDPEFAKVGPFAYDIAAVLSILTTRFFYFHLKASDSEYTKWLLYCIETFYTKFETYFLEYWDSMDDELAKFDFAYASYKKEFMQNIFKDVMGYTGILLLHQNYNIESAEPSPVISHQKLLKLTQKRLKNASEYLVVNHKKMNSIEEFIKVCIS